MAFHSICPKKANPGVLFLSTNSSLSPDLELVVCPVMSVHPWLQKKIIYNFLSTFFFLIRIGTTVTPTLHLSPETRSSVILF